MCPSGQIPLKATTAFDLEKRDTNERGGSEKEDQDDQDGCLTTSDVNILYKFLDWIGILDLQYCDELNLEHGEPKKTNTTGDKDNECDYES